MQIDVRPEIQLTEFRTGDEADLVEHLSDRAIYKTTLRIPHPYTRQNAEDWLAIAANSTHQGRPVQFAIRERSRLIGGCGLEVVRVQPQRAELGYWLACPWWGRGIMTAAVSALCRYGFDELELEKLTAHVFDFNPASSRVLEKCGFQQEGFLPRHYRKDGQSIDARLYGLLQPEA